MVSTGSKSELKKPPENINPMKSKRILELGTIKSNNTEKIPLYIAYFKA